MRTSFDFTVTSSMSPNVPGPCCTELEEQGDGGTRLKEQDANLGVMGAGHPADARATMENTGIEVAMTRLQTQNRRCWGDEHVSWTADTVRLVSHGRKLSRRVDDGYINHVGGRALLLSTYTSPTYPSDTLSKDLSIKSSIQSRTLPDSLIGSTSTTTNRTIEFPL
jgi:hypothetical protein